jgi:hypothetical protein
MSQPPDPIETMHPSGFDWVYTDLTMRSFVTYNLYATGGSSLAINAVIDLSRLPSWDSPNQNHERHEETDRQAPAPLNLQP